MCEELRIIFHGCAFRAGVRAVVVICTRVTPLRRRAIRVFPDSLDFAYYDGYLYMNSENRDEWSIENLRLATTPLVIAALDMTCSRFSLAFSKIMKGQFIGNDFITIFDAGTFVPYGQLALDNVQAAYAVTQRLGLGSGSPSISCGSSHLSSSSSLLVAQARSSPKLLVGLPQQSMVTGTRKRKSAAPDDVPMETGKDAADAGKARAARELASVTSMWWTHAMTISSTIDTAMLTHIRFG